MTQIEIRLFASLREGRFSRRTQQVAEGTRLEELLSALEIPPDELGLLMVNGRDAPADHALRDGDVLSLFPLVAGG